MDAAIRYVLYIFLSHLAWFKASTGQESWAAQTRPPNNNNKTSTSHYCYHEVRKKKTWGKTVLNLTDGNFWARKYIFQSKVSVNISIKKGKNVTSVC